MVQGRGGDLAYSVANMRFLVENPFRANEPQAPAKCAIGRLRCMMRRNMCRDMILSGESRGRAGYGALDGDRLMAAISHSALVCPQRYPKSRSSRSNAP